MFPTIRESAAVVSIILLLMLFLPPHYSRRQEANRGCAARGGVDAALGAPTTAALLRPWAGLSGCGLYTDVGRAFRIPLLGAASALRPSALHGTSGDANMTISGAAGTLRTSFYFSTC